MSPTSFMAIFNKAGIACASNQDHTVYQLSKQEPVVIAFNPHSQIPWIDLVGKYKSTGEPTLYKTIKEYALDFESFLKEQNVKEEWNNLSMDDSNIIFMGYGMNDIYPSVFGVMVSVDEVSNRFKYEYVEEQSITLDNDSFWNMLGDFDSISAVLYGSKRNVRELCASKAKESLEMFRSRMVEAAKGLDFEQTLTQKLEEMDCEAEGYRIVNNSTNQVINKVKVGLETFSIEELVYAVEKLVNANVRMTRLINGIKEPVQETKEIAVITRTEGLTWIKHSLFAI